MAERIHTPHPLVRPGPPGHDPVRDRARRVDRERGAALHRQGPPPVPGQPVLGGQRLRADLRRLPPAGRPPGRPAGPPADVHHRADPVRRRVAGRRPVHLGVAADHRPRHPGPGRGHHRPRRAVDRDHHLHRGQGAQHGAGRVGRGGRRRRRGGRAAGRRADRVPGLGVGAAGERADRLRRGPAVPAAAGREPRRPRAELRRARRRVGHRRPGAAGLRAGGRRAGRLGLDQDDLAAGRLAVLLLAAFVAIESRTKYPLVPFSIFRLRTLRGREPRRAAGGHVAVLDVLLHLALPAAGAGLRAAQGGPGLRAAQHADHRERRAWPPTWSPASGSSPRWWPACCSWPPACCGSRQVSAPGGTLRGRRAVPVDARARGPGLLLRDHDHRRRDRRRAGARPGWPRG